ncbi:MAG: SRPBCC domain-containing protein [Polyangiaceae bacterium]|nr:SRPBCC domain-containing protein [Polyangiaceae bacterium]
MSAHYEVVIEAPIEDVWDTLVDLSRYPDWNPFVVRVEAPSSHARVGDSMTFTVRWGTGGGATSVEVTTEMTPPAGRTTGERRRAKWVYAFRGPLNRFNLVRGSRVQELEERSGGATLYKTHESFGGLLARFVPLAKVQDGFERQAKALKTRVESGA